MADDRTIDQELGLSKEEQEQDTLLFHTVDPTLINPPDTETSSIGLKGVDGLVNVSYDSDSPGGDAEDENLDLSLINGMLYLDFIEPDPPFPPSEHGKWVKDTISKIQTSEYRIWYLKSHEKNAHPFDTARGIMYWDFNRELLFFFEPTKDNVMFQTKYPLTINVIGFDDIHHIEGYHNMRNEIKLQQEGN